MDAPISSIASIESRQRYLKRLVFKVQSMQETDQRRQDGIIHSSVLCGDASHMSGISADSRTVTVDSRCQSATLSVLQGGDGSSLFERGPRGRRDGSGRIKSGSRASLSRGDSRDVSTDGSRNTRSSRHQEAKDGGEDDMNMRGGSSRRSSAEPEGDCQAQLSSTESKYNEAMKARKEALDRYSSLARKKASLMTNHNFDKNDRSDSGNSRSTRSSDQSSKNSYRSKSRRSSEGSAGAPPKPSSPPPPPFTNDESVRSFVGKSVAPDDSSSVSSMTSMDSYLKQQYILRELERLKAREVRSHDRARREHSEGRRRVCDRRDGHRSSYHDVEPSERRSSRDRHLDQSKKSRSMSASNHRDSRNRRGSLESIKERSSDISHSRSTAARNRHDQDRDQTHNESDFSKSTKRKNKNPTCNQSHNTSHTPTLSQLEECCIKHPHILLSDQSDINVWTCMRYCKDEKTGRWITEKKVCQACLEEDEEHGGKKTAPHSDNKKHHFESSYYDDETHSVTSSEDEFSSQYGNPNTINVYTDDGNQTPLEREAEAQRRRFIRRLAARAYHFPGNSWCEDWTQYIANTHLVFGIFFHHPLHPVTSRERCIILLGSVAVGLLMSNLIYLWFLHEHIGIEETFIHLGQVNVTKLMITLWTLGSFVHTIFDLSVWHIKACTLCRYGGEVSDAAVRCGRRSGVTIVLMTLAFATYLCLVRASQDAKDAIDGANPDYDIENNIENSFFHPVTLAGSRKSFDFLLGYIIEFILAVFVYSPVILSIVFTGVLGCNGRIPILGGRPREMAKEQRYAMKRQRYIMPQTLKLGDEEYEADMWGDEKLATKF